MKTYIALAGLFLASCVAEGSDQLYQEPLSEMESELTGTCSPITPCGLWVRDTEGEAYLASQAKEEPDILQFTIGHTSCSDLEAMAQQRWPGRYHLRYVESRWLAR